MIRYLFKSKGLPLGVNKTYSKEGNKGVTVERDERETEQEGERETERGREGGRERWLIQLSTKIENQCWRAAGGLLGARQSSSPRGSPRRPLMLYTLVFLPIKMASLRGTPSINTIQNIWGFHGSFGRRLSRCCGLLALLGKTASPIPGHL